MKFDLSRHIARTTPVLDAFTLAAQHGSTQRRICELEVRHKAMQRKLERERAALAELKQSMAKA